MSDRTTIEWTDTTWNPVTGCDRVSPGCDHCYAETFAERFRGVPGHPYEQGFDLKLWPERLEMPFRWRRPRRVFVNSMSDLFHDGVPDEYILQVFTVMRATPQHTYQLLTKRPGRMASFMRRLAWATPTDGARGYQAYLGEPGSRPLANVWAGTSIELDKYAWRADKLRGAPAAVRFLSLEPLLGPLPSLDLAGIDWVIVGGESGPGARPMHPAWARHLRDRATAAGPAFFFKQWGAWVPETQDSSALTTRTAATALYVAPDGSTRPAARGARGDSATVQRVGKKAAGRLLDGRTWDEMPAVAS